MTTVNIDLTQDEIELLGNALDSHSHLRDVARMKHDLVAGMIFDPKERDSLIEEKCNMSRQQKDQQTLLEAKLVHAKDKLMVEEFAKSL